MMKTDFLNENIVSPRFVIFFKNTDTMKKIFRSAMPEVHNFCSVREAPFYETASAHSAGTVF